MGREPSARSNKHAACSVCLYPMPYGVVGGREGSSHSVACGERAHTGSHCEQMGHSGVTKEMASRWCRGRQTETRRHASSRLSSIPLKP